MIAGGFVPATDDHIHLNKRNARLCLDELHGSRLPLYHDTDIPELFAKGTMLFARHWSFTCSELLEKSRFEWEAVPLPLSPKAKAQTFLSVIAVAKTAGANDSALRLATYLTEQESQQEFARAGGNLPVRVSSLSAMLEAGTGQLSMRTLQKVLRDADIVWPHRAWRCAEHIIPRDLASKILKGDIHATAALAGIERALASDTEKPA
jgi:hypothetical protein